MTETFHGYIDTTQDVLLVFEGCRRGLLPRVNRRLQEKERKLIQSGSVFVFDERESGVKRWTDGLVWSPSRILGNFLIYRELEKRNGEKRMSISDHRQRSYSVDVSSTVSAAGGGGFLTDRAKEKRLVGSLSDVYNFRTDGLIKKTMSIVVNGSTQHLISYYHPQDIIDNKLRTPSSVPELTSLEISPELLVKQNFRIPPFVEPTFDQIATDTPGGATGAAALNLRYHNQPQYQSQPVVHQQYPPHQHYQQGSPSSNRSGKHSNTDAPANRGSPLRSMSVGSLNSLRQESMLYTDDHQHMNDMNTYNSFNGNSSLPTDNNDKSSRMYTMYYQSQDQLQQHHHHQQQLQQQLSPPQMQMHSISNGVYSSTPSPTSIRYDTSSPNPPQSYNRTHTHHHTPSPNPQLGHLLNPVHPLNSANPNDLPHQVKMEPLDQPIFYGNRASPLSTAHTSRLV